MHISLYLLIIIIILYLYQTMYNVKFHIFFFLNHDRSYLLNGSKYSKKLHKLLLEKFMLN